MHIATTAIQNKLELRLNEQSHSIFYTIFFVIRILLICILNSFNCGVLMAQTNKLGKTVATPMVVEVGCQKGSECPYIR